MRPALTGAALTSRLPACCTPQAIAVAGYAALGNDTPYNILTGKQVCCSWSGRIRQGHGVSGLLSLVAAHHAATLTTPTDCSLVFVQASLPSKCLTGWVAWARRWLQRLPHL